MRRIALFAPDVGDYIHRLVDGVLQYQAVHGNFLLTDYRFNEKMLEEVAAAEEEPTWSHQADGVIAYVGPQRGVGSWLRRGRVPVVNTSADRVGSDLPAIHSDASSIARLAVDHMLELGYREFAHIGYSHSPGSLYREQAYSSELRRRGLFLRTWRLNSALASAPIDLDPLLANDPDLPQLLRDAPKPLAIFSLSDSYGVAALRVCEQLGLNVPRDVGILSIGDTSVARSVTPQLSSVRVPGERIGFEAMALLDRLIRGERDVPRDGTVPVSEIAARGSTLLAPVQDRDIERALQMIREQACVGLDVGDVLGTLKLSRKTFERKFIDAIGHPPGEEIRRVRLDRAKDLLRTTELSVTRVGRMVGFDRGSMFTRFFKTQTGLTPREYRRNEEVATH